MIDPDKIFKLFDRVDQDPPLKEKAQIADQLLALRETPAFKIGMIKKLVFNHINLHNSNIFDFIKRAGLDLDMEDVKNAGEFIIYNRVWEYAKDLDVRDIETFETLKKGACQELLTAIKLCINYFEEKEEYEKCSHLKKLQDVVDFFTR